MPESRVLETALRVTRLIARVATSAVVLTVPVTPNAAAQDFRDHWQHHSLYQIVSLYDRVVDSTRVSAMLLTSVTWSGSGAKVWLTASFTFPGRMLVTRPDSVELAFDSFSREGARLAFSHARELRVEVGSSLRFKATANSYTRLGEGLTDRGRRELLSFRIPAGEFIRLGDEVEVAFRSGPAQFYLTGHAIEMIRDLNGRMHPP